MALKLIIDTDPGIDDAMAIFYAIAAPEIDLLGLTTVFGNVTTPKATRGFRRCDIAKHCGQTQKINLRRSNGIKNRHGVINAGICIDDQFERHGASSPKRVKPL